ncbi:hypothetical protein SAMN04490193_1265 [Pseudomonas marginalis]|nr:hypothetical protein SAMN04490193_1265 [Pseudomonas marginalis]
MAGSSLLVLIDDIAAVLDDVALMTKVAAKKRFITESRETQKQERRFD